MYDFKVYQYKYGTQIRLYNRPIETKEKEEKFNIEKGGQLAFKEKKKRTFESRSLRDPEDTLKHSENRSKNMIYQIARSNEWTWFITFTLDQKRTTDRMNLEESIKDLSEWLRSVKKTRAPDLKYLIVPEEHKNGGWHFHGLFNDTGDLLFVDSGKTVKTNEAGEIPIYNIVDYTLGWSTATKVYISGYIFRFINFSGSRPA